jgi:predicted PurR-regulated permease PerM
MIGMFIFRLPYAPMISALIAFTALVPIAGAYIGAGVGAFLILMVSPIKAFIFLIFIIVLQQIEGNLIYPKVVGSKMGLPAIWVLAAVVLGGGIMGVLGMLIGVPIAATIYFILQEDVRNKLKK